MPGCHKGVGDRVRCRFRSPQFTKLDLQTIPSPITLCIPPVAFAHNLSAGSYGHRYDTVPMACATDAAFLGRCSFRLGFAINTQARRHTPSPKRVRYPTDWSFTFHCSPPHVIVSAVMFRYWLVV